MGTWKHRGNFGREQGNQDPQLLQVIKSPELLADRSTSPHNRPYQKVAKGGS